MKQKRLTIDVISGWVTTILTYPISSHNIDTIDELIAAKLPVYSYFYWKSFLTDRLNNQYIFYSNLTHGFPNVAESSLVVTDEFYQGFLQHNQSFVWHKVSYNQFFIEISESIKF